MAMSEVVAYLLSSLPTPDRCDPSEVIFHDQLAVDLNSGVLPWSCLYSGRGVQDEMKRVGFFFGP